MSEPGGTARRLSGWATDLAVRACAIFHRVSVRGDAVPPGPLLLAANHNHMLIDPLLIMGAAGRSLRPIVKSPHFKTPFFSWVLEGIGALPVYRQQDDVRRLARNRTTLEDASAALRNGDALLVFPEGGSEAVHGLRPLKAGTARVALAAEAETGWALGVRVVPIGLALECPQRFRSRAAVAIGPPIAVSARRAGYGADPAGATRALTEELRTGIEAEQRRAREQLARLQAKQLAERTTGLQLASWLAGMLLAVLGTAGWLLPAAAAGLAPLIGRTEPSTVSTVKLLTAIVAFPLAYAGWLLISLAVTGPIGVGLAAVGLPWLGVFAIGWHDRRSRIMGEWRARRAGAAETEAIE